MDVLLSFGFRNPQKLLGMRFQAGNQQIAQVIKQLVQEIFNVRPLFHHPVENRQRQAGILLGKSIRQLEKYLRPDKPQRLLH